MWQSIFRHDELDLILVVYADDFKMAGPKKNLAKGWAGIRSVVVLGEPEPYDRYFGCMHVEKNGVKLPIGAHPFARVFDPQRASACSAQIHRKNDYWEHDPNHQTWTRHHLQPRKKLFFPGDEGGQFNGSLKPQRTTLFNAAVIINDGSPNATNARLPKERIDTYEDDWTLKNPNMKTDIFWQENPFFIMVTTSPVLLHHRRTGQVHIDRSGRQRRRQRSSASIQLKVLRQSLLVA